jgi:hypothetical protein
MQQSQLSVTRTVSRLMVGRLVIAIGGFLVMTMLVVDMQRYASIAGDVSVTILTCCVCGDCLIPFIILGDP